MTKPKLKEQPDLLSKVEPPRGNVAAAMDAARKDDAKAAEKAAAKPKPRAEVAKVHQLPAKIDPPAQNLLGAIIAAASDPKCQPEKMHALLDVRNRLMRERAEVGYRRAYRAAKAEMPRIAKDGRIDEGTTRSGRLGKKTMYATYENINKIVGPILEKNGLDLSLHAEPKPTGEGVLMRATLSHVATTEYGDIVYSESTVVPMPPDPTGSKNAAQAMSSALAYAKRNAVILVLNLISHAPEDRDDDGRAAGGDENPAISGEQLKELLAAIEDCGVGADTFCNKYSIKHVMRLPAAMFDEAMTACKNFKANRGAR